MGSLAASFSARERAGAMLSARAAAPAIDAAQLMFAVVEDVASRTGRGVASRAAAMVTPSASTPVSALDASRLADGLKSNARARSARRLAGLPIGERSSEAGHEITKFELPAAGAYPPPACLPREGA